VRAEVAARRNELRVHHGQPQLQLQYLLDKRALDGGRVRAEFGKELVAQALDGAARLGAPVERQVNPEVLHGAPLGWGGPTSSDRGARQQARGGGSVRGVFGLQSISVRRISAHTTLFTALSSIYQR
jgi:hypothetical protein